MPLGTARTGRRGLRNYLEFLAENTDADKINPISYSAGARTLAFALHGLRLKADEDDEMTVRRRYKIGQVVYAGPDIDADVWGLQYQDDMGDLADQYTIYTTKKDKALGMSKFLFGYKRLGALEEEDFEESTLEFLSAQEQTNFVIVSDAEKALEANAHNYFRQSPWVASDVVLILRHGLPPSERGLVRDPESFLWRFPADYPERVTRIAHGLYGSGVSTAFRPGPDP